ncbi:MAG: ribonuclease P protein component [Bacteroidota bacterium]
MKDNCLRKEERLTSKIHIDSLFMKGRHVFSNFIKIVWMDADYESDCPVKTAFTVPRKKVKNAVDRNRIKRRLRESFRKNKHIIYDKLNQNNRKIVMMIIYQSDELYDSPVIEEKIIISLERLKNNI